MREGRDQNTELRKTKGVSWLLLWTGGPQSCWRNSEESHSMHLRIVPLKAGRLGCLSSDFHPPWQKATPGDVVPPALQGCSAFRWLGLLQF